ncbi:MAG: hypothetical protein ACD_30C00002G0006 [uncultured bacterium]|uniref:Large ribosomal subunit protein uL23 n=4 Tax=Candidatus Daviesiibacteriota TaxID=1752718 RepID=A0A0G0FA44_9BACT|nr:MAG: hypothetical protein ACD_30C00002G0006 [uncultured bacterium]KKQ10400.1 MAG: 50S ribosomal protein L23 [Candidatus Daviesbacteria bacterium GW2011_GWB1_36_5]KKQ15779.1 MAG: 50S ribosomal protein L23 [Candidatus Daviesbacteria bacterium GW2011_GWA1_36_8]OGE16560.1 MAG: 50S ribosomal protein L23 [Candidatus Daviesbacteria bacterium RIFCSPHIGHO2_01_FULL_36_37]OGE31757.1 MAG: 50S ribosomal protein L23 [Candidatus Daviesbacteria bacterium RIFCSPHIGHO2_02_FULL_37_9]OGE34643.1 MAG: 50S riboso
MNILLRPLINEKSMNLVTQSQFSFEVDGSASKKVIEKIVEDKFKVDVVSVKIINLKPKQKLQRSRRGKFLKGGMKKAIVKLKKGQNIPLFETVKEQDAMPAGRQVEVKTAEGEVLTTIKEKKSLLKGTKVRVEKASDKEKIIQETENRAPTKTSQKPVKKKGVR